MTSRKGRERGVCQTAPVTAARSNAHQPCLRKREFRMVVAFSTGVTKRISPNALTLMQRIHISRMLVGWHGYESPLGKLTK